ncbi:hypothetical protein [Mesorhizobium sp.]|uniref:hypothetical protein n=1 Tax=Mesorhizobium sp. TaxID=1871066 RepID=UPI00257B9C9A|nr:hypothetical protein [Mesorhizobium sp.]
MRYSLVSFICVIIDPAQHLQADGPSAIRRPKIDKNAIGRWRNHQQPFVVRRVM